MSRRVEPVNRKEPTRRDVRDLTRADLESRARTAGTWGVDDARRLVAEEALAWARDVLKINGVATHK